MCLLGRVRVVCVCVCSGCVRRVGVWCGLYVEVGN